MVTAADKQKAAKVPVRPFRDPDPFRELGFANPIAARRAIADEVRLPLAKLSDDDIAAETTVEQSAITLLQGLAAQLKAAAEDPAQVKALASQIEQNTAALSAAITANTPPPPA